MKYPIHVKVKALIIATRPQTTPLGMIGVYVGGLVAGTPYNSPFLLLAVLATFFITGASMPFNDYFDRDVDKINHPERAIPRGIISPRGMLYFSFILFGIGLTLSLFVNWLCFVIAIIALVVIVVYEIYSKHTGLLSNMTVAVASAGAFTYGGATVISSSTAGNPFASLILSVMTFFAMTGRETIMDIRDAEGDKLLRKTLPHTMGKRKAANLANFFLLATVALAPVPYFLGIFNQWYLVAMIPAGAILILTVVLMYRDVNNAALSAETTRWASAAALVAFIVGILA
jgi:geranylgeranylglycerol-phosphate geranylgeranyltransferase